MADASDGVARGTEADGGTRGIGFADGFENFVDGMFVEGVAINGCAASEKLVKDDAEGVDVGAGVDIKGIHLGLFGTHVLQRADDLAELGEERLISQASLMLEGFGESEVDDLGNGATIVERDQDVGWLEVAVDYALLVGMLHRVAYGDE